MVTVVLLGHTGFFLVAADYFFPPTCAYIYHFNNHVG